MKTEPEHGEWSMDHFPWLYRRDGPAWKVNRKGTIRDPVWDEATANESRLLDERERRA